MPLSKESKKLLNRPVLK